MFMTIARPAVEPQGPDSVAVPGSPAIPELSPRALHARLLQNAALRRMRGAEPVGGCGLLAARGAGRRAESMRPAGSQEFRADPLRADPLGSALHRVCEPLEQIQAVSRSR